MTDTYLRSLGFAPTVRSSHNNSVAFSQAWRYQYDHLAKDGTPLFIEHPLGVDNCWLSAVEAPLEAREVFAHIGLHDRPALEAAVTAFYAAHGGMGSLVPVVPTHGLRPYHRQY